LISALSVENVPEIYEIGELARSELLMKESLRFIKNNLKAIPTEKLSKQILIELLEL